MIEEILNQESVSEDQVAPTGNEIDSPMLVEDESKKQEESEEIDYKAELAKALEAKDKAENKIVKLKKSRSDIDEDELYERLINRVREEQNEALTKIQLETQLSVLDNEVNKVSTNEDEANLIKHHLENSIKSSGNIKEDIRRAKLLANEKQILRRNKELGQALISKNTAGSANYGGRRETAPKQNKVSAKEAELLKRFGVDV